MKKELLNIALVGNPNSGKSTLFNALTGLNQKTGNFPGVTVEKHSGRVRIFNPRTSERHNVNFIDLPGTYCLFPKSLDELETYKAITDRNNDEYPDKIIVVADASNLKRSLLLCLQVLDLGIPTVLAVNMIDLLERSNLKLDTVRLAAELGIPVIPVNSRDRKGILELKQALFQEQVGEARLFEKPEQEYPELTEELKQHTGSVNAYQAVLKAANYDLLSGESEVEGLKQILRKHGKTPFSLQSEESLRRYRMIETILDNCINQVTITRALDFTMKLDAVFTHPFWGFIIFLSVLFVVFQSVFSWAELPMDWIDNGFLMLSEQVSALLPAGAVNDLITQGILPGLGGIFMFIPQIAILFAFIAMLEDSGYMARVSFIMDRLLRKFGINGRSVIPLISGVACAVPAIMSARTIKNRKERLLTIFVTPLMSCSARLPVYTLLIAIAVPDQEFGFMNLKGIIMMGLYLIGFIAAIGTSWVMKWLIKSKERSYFIMEMPVYRMPQLRVVGLTMVEKVKVFIRDAGKIIVAISIVLWGLSSYGPGDRFSKIEAHYSDAEVVNELGEQEAARRMSSEKLRNSYAGIMGKQLEPVIAPLGFDWKIGIALVTSFAAREVFVGTMATIYGADGEDETGATLKARMRNDKHDGSGLPVFTIAASMALILFYAFAMQCMSTIAVVYRETGSRLWPVIQFVYMGALAWLAAFAAYTFLS
ncbi:MAG: ferrous iron transport protein B [Bacteroidetes bacterium]|nr:ferrous iron transport protein B [Bacteroidota bacterium]